MSDLTAVNPASAVDAVVADMFKAWFAQQQQVTDEKGERSPAVGGPTLGGRAAVAAAPVADVALAAAQAAGVPPAWVAGAMAAGSAGRDIMAVARTPDQPTGPMGISQNTWQQRVLPTLSAADKAHIFELTGKPADKLNMNDLRDNVVGGVFALRALAGAPGNAPVQTAQRYVANAMGLAPGSALGSSSSAAFIEAMNELERRQALKPRPRVASPGASGAASGGGAVAGGEGVAAASGGRSGGSSAAAPRTEAPAQSPPAASPPVTAGPGQAIGPSGPVSLKNFPTAGDNVHFKNPAIERYRDDILRAYHATGIPPEIIGAQMWHESRGNMSVGTTNSDGTRDIGLMQIGQARAQGYLRHFGLSGSLDVNNPADNIMAGALEIKYWLQQSGGDLRGALNGYVSGSVRGGNGIGDPNYASNCLRYMDLIRQGQPLPDSD
jgi:hypothetical protein